MAAAVLLVSRWRLQGSYVRGIYLGMVLFVSQSQTASEFNGSSVVVQLSTLGTEWVIRRAECVSLLLCYSPFRPFRHDIWMCGSPRPVLVLVSANQELAQKYLLWKERSTNIPT
jgi:hypothetical protein